MNFSRKICGIALPVLLSVFLAPTSARGERVSVTASSTAGFILTPKPLVGEFTRDLAIGMRGDDVSALQQFLITGGFLDISGPTGFFGSETRAAVRMWQASVGITPSVGFFGPVSRAKIGEAATRVSPDVVRVPDIAPPITLPVATTAPATIDSTTLSPIPPDGRPLYLVIPTLGIVAAFQYTGFTADGIMEIPDNIIDVGWFEKSPRPGEIGSAIVTGHVAQIRGGVVTKQGVFSRLHELRAGDRLYVLNDKGEAVTFMVRESRSLDPSANATDVFTSVDGGAHLNLITCEGTWSVAEQSYSQRLVLFTDRALENASP